MLLSGQLLEVPGMVSSEMDSTRSSLSEVSVISTASTSRTFLDEASTLVLETLENDIKKLLRNVTYTAGTSHLIAFSLICFFFF